MGKLGIETTADPKRVHKGCTRNLRCPCGCGRKLKFCPARLAGAAKADEKRIDESRFMADAQTRIAVRREEEAIARREKAKAKLASLLPGFAPFAVLMAAASKRRELRKREQARHEAAAAERRAHMRKWAEAWGWGAKAA